MTFSIVACDRRAGEIGVAVQSRVIAVGAVVPFARAGVGAVATQAWSNKTYGPRGLALLAEGADPEAVVARLVREDPDPSLRQVGIVDARGRAAAYTGPACPAWAGARTGDGFAAQGNTLAGPAVVAAMAEAYVRASGRLADRLVEALRAGQREGGDRRGMQSAALLVVRANGGYGGFDDRLIDLRVDEHPDPIEELARILGLFQPWSRGRPPKARELDPATVRELQAIATRAGAYAGPVSGEYDAATRDAVRSIALAAGARDRWTDEPRIDEAVLELLRTRHPDERETGGL